MEDLAKPGPSVPPSPAAVPRMGAYAVDQTAGDAVAMMELTMRDAAATAATAAASKKKAKKPNLATDPALKRPASPLPQFSPQP